MADKNTAAAADAVEAPKVRSRRERFYDTPVSMDSKRVEKRDNPKKKGSMSYDRFECYFDLDWTKPQTVRTALKAGVRMDDIRHDSEHGFITLGETPAA